MQESQAFQIRFGRVKDVVYSGVQSLLDSLHEPKRDLKILLRELQIKFDTSSSGILLPGLGHYPSLFSNPVVKALEDSGDLTLRIASTAGESCSSLFFGPIIKALEDFGINTRRIENIYNETYGKLTSMSCQGLDILPKLCRISDKDLDTDLQARHILFQLAICLKRDNFFLEDYKLILEALFRQARRESPCQKSARDFNSRFIPSSWT